MASDSVIDELSAEESEDLLRTSTLRTYPRNTVVINEGDDTDAVYFILSGRVKVFLADENGREVDIGFLGAGDYFGEMALEPGYRSASVMTLDSCKLAMVRIEDFRLFLRHHPDFAFQLITRLIRRARAVTKNLKNLALLDVYGRLAQLLHELSRAEDDHWVIDEPLSQQQIACRIGCSREMVSRIFKDLVAGGYLTVFRGRIDIRRRLPRSW
jgi:CRP/FNR family transcriptional regulator, cyclic AMP receptor protein